MRVAFCSSEVFPFAKTGGLGDVAGALPLALEKLGIEVNVILPLYRCVDLKDLPTRRLNKDIVRLKVGKNIQVYFIEHEGYFDREGIYGTPVGDYGDNLDRFVFYCRRTLELLKQVNFKADVIHGHDWQTALIPVYLKTLLKNDGFYKKMSTVMTIHNMAYQGIFPKAEYSKLGLSRNFFDMDGFEFYDQINLLKGGILFCDYLTTVSPQYAREIQTPTFGCRLEHVIRQKKEIIGILNGLDNNLWNPETDVWIEHRYSRQTFQDKIFNKRKLQKDCGFALRDDMPVLSFIGRLNYQKGIDLMVEALPELCQADLQVVILGFGDERYHRILQEQQERYPRKLSVHLKFSEPLAHLIYAGSDFFLMPSRYEPCGLGQMISLRYGTIPIVHKTGGLADTVRPFDVHGNIGNGFVFEAYQKDAFLKSIREALDCFRHKDIFGSLVQKVFADVFPWEESAKKYRRIYERCLSSA